MYRFAPYLALICAVSALPAAAQDTTRFFGPYGGVSLGQGSFATDVLGTEDDEEDITSEGGVFGAFVGYNLQFRNVVWGLEADVMTGNLDLDVQSGDTTLTLSPDYFASVRGRLGYVLGGSTMIVASAGPGYYAGDLELSAPTGSASQSEDQIGLSLGLGAEHLILDGPWLIRGDVRVMSGFGGDRETFNLDGTTATVDNRDYGFAAFSLGLGARF